MKTGRFIATGAGIAGLTSLYYMFAYISRWEWNRAQMAGTFTVIALLVAFAIVIDGRLRQVRRALDALAAERATAEPVDEQAPTAGPAHPGTRPVAAVTWAATAGQGPTDATDADGPATGGAPTDGTHPSVNDPAGEQPPGRRDFAWLTVAPERYGVFIPLLLGAGMLASGLAWVVERISSRVGGAGGARAATTAKDGARDRDTGWVSPLPSTLLLPPDACLDDARPVGEDPADIWLRGPRAWS